MNAIKQRPNFLTYRSIDGTEHTLVLDYIAGFQAVHREGDVFGVLIITAGGCSLAVHEPLTEQQANALCEYIRGLLIPETIDRAASININRLVGKIKDALPEKQIVVPDGNLIPMRP